MQIHVNIQGGSNWTQVQSLFFFYYHLIICSLSSVLWTMHVSHALFWLSPSTSTSPDGKKSCHILQWSSNCSYCKYFGSGFCLMKEMCKVTSHWIAVKKQGWWWWWWWWLWWWWWWWWCNRHFQGPKRKGLLWNMRWADRGYHTSKGIWTVSLSVKIYFS